MNDDNATQPPMTYAERLRGRRKSDEAKQAEHAAERKREIADSMDRRNTRAGTIADRLGISQAAEEAARQDAAREEQRRTQEKVSSNLKEAADQLQSQQGLSYKERLELSSPPKRDVSTKDLRTPSERRRAAMAEAERRRDEQRDDLANFAG